PGQDRAREDGLLGADHGRVSDPESPLLANLPPGHSRLHPEEHPRLRGVVVSDRTETFEQLLRLEPGRTALLVVDMQRGFLDPGAAMEVPEARAIVPVVADLIARFRASRLPVAFSQFVYSPAAPLLVGDLHPEHRPA